MKSVFAGLNSVLSFFLIFSFVVILEVILTINHNWLIDNYEAITAAFTAKHANFKIACSFKTNYLKEIVSIVQSLGALAEAEFCSDSHRLRRRASDLERKYHIAATCGIVNYTEFAVLRERAEEQHEPMQLGPTQK